MQHKMLRSYFADLLKECDHHARHACEKRVVQTNEIWII